MKAPASVKSLASALQRASPRSIRSVLGALEGALHYRDFVALVRQWLPDEEGRILVPALSEEGQVGAFCKAFSNRYFPIHELEQYGDIVGFIPVHTLAYEDEDYHSPESFDTGFRLLFALAEYYDEGMRVVWLEACAELVPQVLLNRIPPEGYGASELKRLLDGTEHTAAAEAVAYFTHNTGNVFLDVPEDWSPEMPDWGDGIVEELTVAWREAEQAYGRIKKAATWLDEDPEARFRDLLDFIEAGKRKVPDWRGPGKEPAPANRALAEIFTQEEMDIGIEQQPDDE